jgi:hypothetical protein
MSPILVQPRFASLNLDHFSNILARPRSFLIFSNSPQYILLISRSFSPSLEHFSLSLPQPRSASPVSRPFLAHAHSFLAQIADSSSHLELISGARAQDPRNTAIKNFRPQPFSPARPPLPQEGDMVSPSRSAAPPPLRRRAHTQ